MQPEKSYDSGFLDYAPLRLGVMALWGKWSIAHYPHAKNWYSNKKDSYALTAPVLRFNLFMEIIGLISAFFLARLWAIRGNPSPPTDPTSLRYFFRGCVPGFVAVLLLWFNPAIVLSAYGWPTWDLWIIPMFLLAALMASIDWWFTAGLVIGIGAMFKGQQLLAVTVFMVWSLMLFRPLRTLRFLGGVVLAIAVITSPWLLTYIPADQLAQAREIQSEYPETSQVPAGTFKLARNLDLPALIWVIGILLGACLLPFVGWLRSQSTVPRDGWRKMMASPWTYRLIAASIAFALFVWPWFLKRNRPQWETGYLSAWVLAGAVLLIRPRGIAYLAAAATGAALLLCILVFHGSTAWYDCGLHFGTIHWPYMIMGRTDNLPGIMENDFNWSHDDITVIVTTIRKSGSVRSSSCSSSRNAVDSRSRFE